MLSVGKNFSNSMLKHRVKRVWTDDKAVYAETYDGLTASYNFSEWKRLADATPEQRNDFYLTYSGIHWKDIDEDLSFEGMFASEGLCSNTVCEDSVYYEAD